MSAHLKSSTVALVGPPNAGKTTLFNALTGAGSHAVNYPGATVDYLAGNARRSFGVELRVVDTPGTYSLTPKSPEERVTRELLFGEGPEKPGAVIVVADGTQLSRHLPMVRQVIESGYAVLVAVTMRDLLERDGIGLDLDALARKLGVPVFAVNGLDLQDVEALATAAARVAASPAKITAPKPWSGPRQEMELKWAGQIATQVLNHAAARTRGTTLAERTRALDRALMHPVWGLVFFALIMSGLFTSIFWVAAPAMDLISETFERGAAWVLGRAPGSLWSDFLGGGILLSIGAIMTFVPQIAMLFLGITLLEDSGYLARAATLIDRPLTRLGLNGRSFVPLLSGYACAIPAMLAARTIPNRKERWLTLFIIPLMSCSARLPVYALLLAFLFWGQSAWKPGVALAGLYLLSLFIGAIAAAVASRMLKIEETSFFMLELPLYRRPSFRAVWKTVYLRTDNYIRKAGPAIFVFAIALWAATTFPHYDAPTPSEKLNQSYAAGAGKFIDPLMQPMGGDWRTGVALISAFAAREVFVASLGLVLQVSESDEAGREISLLDAMRTARREDGHSLFTPASAVGLILFFMIALQCMSTVAVARREFGNWTWPLVQLVVFNVAAYAIAVVAVQSLHAAGIP